MVATNQNIGGTSSPYYEGDSLLITFDVNKSDGSDKNLDNASVEWVVKDETGTLLTDSNSGVSTSIDASSDTVNIKISSGTTDDMAGSYEHYLRITSGGDTVTVTTGDFIIHNR